MVARTLKKIAASNMPDLLQGAFDANQAQNPEQCLVQLMLVGQLARQKYGYYLNEPDWQYPRSTKSEALLKRPSTDVGNLHEILKLEKKLSPEKSDEDVELQRDRVSDQQVLLQEPRQASEPQDWSAALALSWWALSLAYEAPYEEKVGNKPMTEICRLKTTEEIEIGRRFFHAFYKPPTLNTFQEEADQKLIQSAIPTTADRIYHTVFGFKTNDEKRIYQFGRVMSVGYAMSAVLMGGAPVFGLCLILGVPIIFSIFVGTLIAISSVYLSWKTCRFIVGDKLVKSARSHYYDHEGKLKFNKGWKYVIGIAIALGEGITFGVLTLFGAIMLPTLPGLGVLSTLTWLTPTLWGFGIVLGLCHFTSLFALTLQAVLKYTQRTDWRPLHVIKCHFKNRFTAPQVFDDKKKQRILDARYHAEKLITIALLAILVTFTIVGFTCTLYAGGRDLTALLITLPFSNLLLCQIFGFGLTAILAAPGEAAFDIDTARLTVENWSEKICDKLFKMDRDGVKIIKKASEQGSWFNPNKWKLDVSRFLSSLGYAAIPVTPILYASLKRTVVTTGPLIALSALGAPHLLPFTLFFATVVYIGAFFNCYTMVAMELDREKMQDRQAKTSIAKIEGALMTALQSPVITTSSVIPVFASGAKQSSSEAFSSIHSGLLRSARKDGNEKALAPRKDGDEASPVSCKGGNELQDLTSSVPQKTALAIPSPGETETLATLAMH